jgi:riboflavin kinase/FMN adenylyltransferase
MSQLLTSLDNFPPSLRGAAVSIGNFDGVHRGHAALIRQLVAAAREVGGPAIVMTFDPPPVALLFPDRPLTAPLTTIQRRAELVFALGADALLAYPLDHDLLSLSAEDFFRQKILGILQARAMVEGPNFRFGRNREGGIEQLRTLCAAANVVFHAVTETTDEAGMISSTRIRQLLSAGCVAEANAMLTQAYTVAGVVSPGAQRGRELGFPTANLEQIESLIPGYGVYAGQVNLPDSVRPAAINIGPNPTFEDNRTKVEVHIVGYHGPELYGSRLNVALSTKIRDVRKFESITALRKQVAHDVEVCAMRSLGN